MKEDEYKTIEAPTEAIYTEKRSKFLAFAIPVRTKDEIKALEEAYAKAECPIDGRKADSGTD